MRIRILKLLALLIFVLLSSTYVAGQSKIEAKKKRTQSKKDRVYEYVEVIPEFAEGVDAMMLFIQRNVKYPEVAMDNGIEGTAVVQFVVEKDGSITNINVVRDPGGGLGREAQRVVELMPNWTPGRLKRKKRKSVVRVLMSTPIRFRLSR